jgi:Zn-finger protein
MGENCGGNFKYTASGVKSCVDCLRPHVRENYDQINDALRKK